MKDKLLSIFVTFVRKTFTKERLLDLIDDLLDIVYDRFVHQVGDVDDHIIDQTNVFLDVNSKEANLEDGV